MDEFTAVPKYKSQKKQINDLYDKQRDAELAALKGSFDDSMAEYEATKEKLPQAYRAAANQSAAEYQREKAAFDESAAASGINTGAGSQVKLSMLNNQNATQGSINQARADATANIDLQIANLKRDYDAGISEAIAKNDYQRAAALLEDSQRKQEQALKAAQEQYDREWEQWKYYQQHDLLPKEETETATGGGGGYNNNNNAETTQQMIDRLRGYIANGASRGEIENALNGEANVSGTQIGEILRTLYPTNVTGSGRR